MTTDHALALMVNLSAAFPRTEIPEPTAKLYLEHLVPLPYERTKAGLERLVTTARFFPTIAELLEAAGVDDDESRTQLLAAMSAKQPLVRDAASATGWAVGRALLPPELIPPQAKSLPAGPVVGEEQRAEVKARMLALANRLGGGAR